MYKPCECGSVLFKTNIFAGIELVEIDAGCPDVLMHHSIEVDETDGDYTCVQCGKDLEEIE